MKLNLLEATMLVAIIVLIFIIATTNPVQPAGQSKSFSDIPIENQKIVFVSVIDGNSEIYIINNDGTNLKRLTNDTAIDKDPAISPDGKKIVFVSLRDGSSEIYLMDSEGNNIRRLTNNSAVDSEPVWSRDSKYIAFVSQIDGNDQIYVMNTDTLETRKVTDFLSWSPSW